MLLATFLSIQPYAQAQNKYTISGYIKDAASGESLLGAHTHSARLGRRLK